MYTEQEQHVKLRNLTPTWEAMVVHERASRIASVRRACQKVMAPSHRSAIVQGIEACWMRKAAGLMVNRALQGGAVFHEVLCICVGLSFRCQLRVPRLQDLMGRGSTMLARGQGLFKGFATYILRRHTTAMKTNMFAISRNKSWSRLFCPRV